MFEKDDPRIVRVSVDKYSTPRNGYVRNFVNRFWCYDPETDSVLFYKPDKRPPRFGFPQCNDRQNAAEHLQSKLYPWAETKQIELISIPSDED